jgi:hypothetical protein
MRLCFAIPMVYYQRLMLETFRITMLGGKESELVREQNLKSSQVCSSRGTLRTSAPGLVSLPLHKWKPWSILQENTLKWDRAVSTSQPTTPHLQAVADTVARTLYARQSAGL